MASIDSVEDLDSINQYTASASQTEFDFKFPIADEDDLVVYDGDDLQALTTNYTVTGVGEDTGGSIVFTSGREAGAVITLYRDAPIERTTDYQQNGPWTSDSLNDELDRITMWMQQLERNIGRTVRLSLRNPQASSELELSPSSAWANRYLYINEDGELEASAAVATTTLSQSIIAELLNPQTEAEASVDAEIENYAYKPGHAFRYGVMADGVTDDTDAIHLTLAACAAGGYLADFPAGKYRITDEIVWPTKVRGRGAGDFWSPSASQDTWFFYDGTTSTTKAVIRASGVAISTAAEGEPTGSAALSNIKIENMVLDANNKAGYGLYAAYVTNDSVLDQITGINANEHGILIIKAWYLKPGRLTARNCPGRGITIGNNGDFDAWNETSVNGVVFPDLRAHTCGTAFTSTGTAWDESTDITKGYGIGFFPRSASRVINAVAERTRGAGVVYSESTTGPSGIDLIYTEICCSDESQAEWAGASERWGLIVKTRTTGRGARFGQVYLGAGSSDTYNSLWITGDAPSRPPVFGQILHGENIIADSAGLIVETIDGLPPVGGTIGYGTKAFGGKLQIEGGDFAYGLANTSLALRTKAAQDIDFADNSATTIVEFSVPNPGSTSSRGVSASAMLSVGARAFESSSVSQTQNVLLAVTIARTPSENTAVTLSMFGAAARSVDGSPTMTALVVGDFSAVVSGAVGDTQTVAIRVTKSHGVASAANRELAYHCLLMGSGVGTASEDVDFV